MKFNYKTLPEDVLEKYHQIFNFFISLKIGINKGKLKKIDKFDVILPFIHKSYIADFPKFKNQYTSNERLEFLGDSVVGLVIADLLFENFLSYPESSLSFMKIEFVKAESLSTALKNLNKFGAIDLIFLSKGEEINGGKDKESILANVFEAITGFIYLFFGFETAYKFIKKYLFDFLLQDIESMPLKNYKTLVQEYFQKKYKKLPEYKVEEIAFDREKNQKTFKAKIFFEDKILAEGIGKSKKKAEFAAAEKLAKELKLI